MADRNLELVIKANDLASKEINKLEKNIKQITKTTNKASKGMSDFAKKNSANFKRMAGLGVTALAGLGFGMKKLVDQASDLEETTQKFNVVYRDLRSESESTAKQLAKDYGLSQKSSKQFLADLGDVTSGFGLSQEASLDYAEQVVKMGVDLASFANIAGGSEEAIDRLNKGFLGEHENLKALGIIINDTMLKNQLLADGTEKLTGLELESAKIRARMTIATRQSANAIGDFDRSKASLANQTRILQSNMEDLTTELGMAFLPIVTQITTAIIPVIKNLSVWVGENQELAKVIGIATIAIAGIITVLGTLGLALPIVTTGATALGSALMFLAANPIGLVITAISALIIAGVLLVKNWDTVGSAVEVVGEKILTVWGYVKQGTMVVFDSIYDYVAGKIQAIIDFAMSAVNIVKGAFKRITDIKQSIKSAVGGAISSVKEKVSGARADGGPVNRGKTYLVGERGPELFTPKTSGQIIPNGGGGGVTINMGGVSVSNQADENRLVNKIKKVFIQDAKRFNLGIT